jgi:hypothetical protein
LIHRPDHNTCHKIIAISSGVTTSISQVEVPIPYKEFGLFLIHGAVMGVKSTNPTVMLVAGQAFQPIQQESSRGNIAGISIL